MTRRTLNALRFAMAAAAGTICLFINDNMSSAQRPSLITQADAEIGQPWTAMSGAGVARRHARRAYYRNAGYYGAYTAGYRLRQSQLRLRTPNAAAALLQRRLGLDLVRNAIATP